MSTDQKQDGQRSAHRTGNTAAIAVATTMAAALTACAPADTAILEIAVYTANDPQRHSAIRIETRKRLSQEPGFLWWHPLNIVPPTGLPGHSSDSGDPIATVPDGGDSNVFADVLAWESIEAARAAAKKVESDPAYRPFVESIADIRHFTHYRAWNTADRIEQILKSARFIEIAAYTVRDPGQHIAAQRLLYEAKLPGRQGLEGGARLERLDPVEGPESDRAFGDLLGWQSIAAWQATGAAMMADPELKAFFEGIDESIVFALFTADAGNSQ